MAFHSYTRLVRKLFNAYRCGPPSRVTGTSPWASVDHSVSRLPPPTRRPLQARFHCGAAAETPYLAGDGNSQAHYAKGTPSHDKNHAPTACRRMVSGSISPSSSECFSPFPHGTGTLSVSREYLALPDGPGGFAQDSTCPALLRVPLCPGGLRVRGFHPLRPPFPERSARLPRYNVAALLPRGGRNRRGLGSSPVARHYWGNHCCFLFLRVLRCFSSPRLPHRTRGDDGLMAAGLSHSEIRGSQAVCAYPRLFAAYHVLLRLREPRHPPCALALFLLEPGRPRYSRGARRRLACAMMSKIVALKGHVENNGFEPLTPCLQGRCSSQLS